MQPVRSQDSKQVAVTLTSGTQQPALHALDAPHSGNVAPGEPQTSAGAYGAPS